MQFSRFIDRLRKNPSAYFAIALCALPVKFLPPPCPSSRVGHATHLRSSAKEEPGLDAETAYVYNCFKCRRLPMRLRSLKIKLQSRNQLRSPRPACPFNYPNGHPFPSLLTLPIRNLNQIS